MDSGSLFDFLHHCRIGDFMRFLTIFYYNHPQIFTKLGEVTDANKASDPHFGSDTADIRFQIKLEI